MIQYCNFKSRNNYILLMASSIYNLRHPLRTGNIRLAPSGKEVFGTVIRDGKMNKTVTVSSITYD